MKKVSFRVRNFDKEQFLTFNIDNDACLDEDLLDFLEEEEPAGLVPVIFEEGEEFDTFSYNVTDKIHLIDLSNQEITAEMVLRVFHSLVLTLINMAEYRVPLSYLVLNRDYIYVDSDYRIEFICIPIEEMKEETDINLFLRHLVASLRFDPSENGDYVAKLLTYINDRDNFKLRDMIVLIEDLMIRMDVDIPEDETADIYVDYQEVSEEPAYEESVPEEEPVYEDNVPEEEPVYESSVPEEEPVYESSMPEEEYIDSEDGYVEDAPEEEYIDSEGSYIEDESEEKNVTGVVVEDDLEEYLAQKELENPVAPQNEGGLKMKRNIKINRASIVRNTQDEIRAEEEADAPESADIEDAETAEVSEVTEEPEEVVSNAKTKSKGKAKDIPKAPPKVNPYLIRINTDERIMITKQTFKLGKASMGNDYSIQGNAAISRVHSIITNKDGTYYIQDNKSTNHTFVNGKILAEGEVAPLTNDCVIKLGDEEFIFKLN